MRVCLTTPWEGPYHWDHQSSEENPVPRLAKDEGMGFSHSRLHCCGRQLAFKVSSCCWERSADGFATKGMLHLTATALTMKSLILSPSASARSTSAASRGSGKRAPLNTRLPLLGRPPLPRLIVIFRTLGGVSVTPWDMGRGRVACLSTGKAPRAGRLGPCRGPRGCTWLWWPPRAAQTHTLAGGP